MQGDQNIIKYLNSLLSDELEVVNQYFLHSRIFDNLGLKRLYNIEHKECMEELNHAALYTKRILFLEGVLSLKHFDAILIQKDVESILRMDLKVEYRTVDRLKDSIKYANSIQDYVSEEIMIGILKDEENHIEFLETELNIIAKIGIPNYIQSQLT